MEILKARINVLQALKDTRFWASLLYPKRSLSIIIHRENKMFHDKIKFKPYLSPNPTLQKSQKGKLQPKTVNNIHMKLKKNPFYVPTMDES